MRGILTTCAELVGAALVAFGAGLLSVPVGVIVAGAALVVFGVQAGDE